MHFRIEQVPDDLQEIVQGELLDIINEYGLVLVVSYMGAEIKWGTGDAAIGLEEEGGK